MTDDLIDRIADIDRKIDIAARKRDQCCDELNKPLLGLTYQAEIDRLIELRDRLKERK